MEPDNERFHRAALQVMGREKAQNGIGTLGEKTLHAILKLYLEPDTTRHEVKLGRYVADIYGDTGVVEIQTRQFDRMRLKLAAFLEQTPVTVVYPVAQVKWLSWLDPQTGEATARRRSPKTGRPQDIFPELYRIKPLLLHPNLRFRILLLELEELRYLNGWSRDKKRGSSRCNRWPRELCEELEVGGTAGYGALVPDTLGAQGPFTSRGYAKACGVSLSIAQTALNVLSFTGTVRRVGKQGNSILYEKTDDAKG